MSAKSKTLHLLYNTLLGGATVVLPAAILYGVGKWLWDGIRSLLEPLAKSLGKVGIESGLYADILSLALVLLICFLLGAMVRTRLGGLLHGHLERLLHKIPGYKIIRETIQQFMGNDRKNAFSQPCLAQVYGENAAWMPAFLIEEIDDERRAVYVPTAPNPTSGMVFVVRKHQVEVLNVSTDVLMKSVISCGVGTSNLFEKRGKTED